MCDESLNKLNTSKLSNHSIQESFIQKSQELFDSNASQISEESDSEEISTIPTHEIGIKVNQNINKTNITKNSISSKEISTTNHTLIHINNKDPISTGKLKSKINEKRLEIEFNSSQLKYHQISGKMKNYYQSRNPENKIKIKRIFK